MAVKNSETHTFKQSQAMSNLPPLENGDRLTRKEFERRYQATTTIKKAELKPLIYRRVGIAHQHTSQCH
ncbi:hypothetical protein MC7420_6850 [Coleofasciculus chthonoplastes PCC 7420]|uniref:Uncharacterized protein n=1 Tax=Coleofasciculus chthonoplastes PCC 7420 TaxID=118168 RepID=B4VWQ4_9CYAN|nr:hypothetical protein MC7420_6850 [Coleofasciculus chthonoplastes PCC 7420]